MNQFPHTVTRVTDENAVEIKTYRFICWAECGAASVVFLNISVVAGGIWTGKKYSSFASDTFCLT